MSFKPASPHSSRLANPLPKVGIRPAIDGRYGGVRESLEEPTLAMARAAAKLISDTLKHMTGEPVECVVPEFCIGGTMESCKAEELFTAEHVGLTLTVTPCWCYGTETVDMDPVRPKAIWGFNGTQRPGAVYLAAALAGHSQMGRPAFGIYGRDVQDLGDTEIPADVAEKILRFVRAGVAVATMKGTSYLALGGTSMGIAGSRVDSSFFEQYLGMRVESVDMAEVAGRMRKGMFDKEEHAAALSWVKANCTEGFDLNDEGRQRTREEKDQDWSDSVAMALIARDLMVGSKKLAELGYHEQARGHNALAGGFQGQRQWTDHFPNGDFMEAILTSSFDWSGVRMPYTFATENDSLNAVTMLLGFLMTGTAQLFADVRTYWSPEAVERVTGWRPTGDAADGFLHLINSGPAALDWAGVSGPSGIKPWHQMTQADVEASLKATTWHASDLGYFPAGGWSTRFRTTGGLPCTMARINLVGELGPVLQIAEGWTLELPEAVHDVLDERTNPTWPTTWFVPRLTGSGPYTDVYSVMAAWGANHGAISVGHIGADLITLASMLRIPVDMHNVAESDVYRPSTWTRFGALDPQAADYLACRTYGPLYK